MGLRPFPLPASGAMWLPESLRAGREEEHREEARRKDSIIAQFTQRIHELPLATSQKGSDPPSQPHREPR